MTTYKQLQDSWILSQWVDSNVDTFGEDEYAIIPEGFVLVTLDDLILLNITTTTYHDIVKLADYVMVENVDPIMDKVVEVTRNVDVVYEFEQFYRLSERLKPLTRNQLEFQINEFHKTNAEEMFRKYGHSSFWNVSQITDMFGMFDGSLFNGDISKWDVSNVKDMEGMFNNSSFNGNISQWDVSNVTDMKDMFRDSQFDGDISKWNISNVTYMKGMFFRSSFHGDISQWDLSNVKDVEFMFSDHQLDDESF